ncbi:5043_t:CDS:2 [Scutellospora calospora]|uniref:5043_t:CDS:1 n=1 Tax=Scutellospora calospora TaxID=85575 RepID=A0ACA9K5J8_9GLOM|nr:5043_t:CDS:2 [Scutellospora calospora]
MFTCNNSNNVSLKPYIVKNLFDHLLTIQEPQQDELELLFAQAVVYLAIQVLNIPTSLAASEQNWSVFATIYNKKKNRLTPELQNFELLNFQETVNNDNENYKIIEQDNEDIQEFNEHDKLLNLHESDDELIDLDKNKNNE